MYRFSSIPFITYRLSVKELIHFILVCILLFVQPWHSSICYSVFCIFCKLPVRSRSSIRFLFDPFGKTIGGKVFFHLKTPNIRFCSFLMLSTIDVQCLHPFIHGVCKIVMIKFCDFVSVC